MRSWNARSARRSGGTMPAQAMRRGGAALTAMLSAATVLTSALPALPQQVAPFAPHSFGSHPFATHPLGRWMVAAVGTFLALRVVLIIGLLVLVWRLLAARGVWHRPDSATQLLRERYARGEITEEEYRKRLATLA